MSCPGTIVAEKGSSTPFRAGSTFSTPRRTIPGFSPAFAICFTIPLRKRSTSLLSSFVRKTACRHRELSSNRSQHRQCEPELSGLPTLAFAISHELARRDNWSDVTGDHREPEIREPASPGGSQRVLRPVSAPVKQARPLHPTCRDAQAPFAPNYYYTKPGNPSTSPAKTVFAAPPFIRCNVGMRDRTGAAACSIGSSSGIDPGAVSAPMDGVAFWCLGERAPGNKLCVCITRTYMRG